MATRWTAWITSTVASITGAGVAGGDKFGVVDVGSTVTKSLTATELAKVPALTAAFVEVAGDTMTGPLVLPTPTTALEAAQITAIDAALGQFALGGYEIGDTGWRDVSSLLATGWTCDAGYPRLRRVGNVVDLHIRNTDYSSGGTTTVLTLPTGFRPDSTVTYLTGNAPALFDSPTVTQGDVLAAGAVRLIQNDDQTAMVTFTTSTAWPATLPGSAA